MSQHRKLIILEFRPRALYRLCRGAQFKPVIITGIAQGGQLTTTEVDNWPADADGVQGPELMARFLAPRRTFRNGNHF